jgi:hypothetical protein
MRLVNSKYGNNTQSLNIFLISSFCVKKAQFKEGADAAAEVA